MLQLQLPCGSRMLPACSAKCIASAAKTPFGLVRFSSALHGFALLCTFRPDPIPPQPSAHGRLDGDGEALQKPYKSSQLCLCFCVGGRVRCKTWSGLWQLWCVSALECNHAGAAQSSSSRIFLARSLRAQTCGPVGRCMRPEACARACVRILCQCLAWSCRALNPCSAFAPRRADRHGNAAQLHVAFVALVLHCM